MTTTQIIQKSHIDGKDMLEKKNEYEYMKQCFIEFLEPFPVILLNLFIHCDFEKVLIRGTIVYGITHFEAGRELKHL